MISKVDEFGRIAIPAEYIKALGICEGSEVEITQGYKIITIKVPVWGCHFCGSSVNLVRIGDKAACKSCGKRICNANENEMLYPLAVEQRKRQSFSLPP